MANRINRAHLEAKVFTINALTNSPAEPYTLDVSKDQYICNPYNFHIYASHPGNGGTNYQLQRMSEGGGTSVVANVTSIGASNFADFLTGIIEGIRIGRSN